MNVFRLGLGLLIAAGVRSLPNPRPAPASMWRFTICREKRSRWRTVTLQAAPGIPPPGGRFAPRAARRRTIPGSAHFADVAPGRYRLSIKAKSFDELTTDVDVNPPEDAAAGNATSIEADSDHRRHPDRQHHCAGRDRHSARRSQHAGGARAPAGERPARPPFHRDRRASAVAWHPAAAQRRTPALRQRRAPQRAARQLHHHDRSGDGAVRGHGADRQRPLDDHSFQPVSRGIRRLHGRRGDGGDAQRRRQMDVSN